MKLKFYLAIFFTFISSVDVCSAADQNSLKNIRPTKDSYLSRPTGQYGIGFEDFHWISTDTCPDFNFNGKNQADFSSNNRKHCHEIMMRIYYPIDKNNQMMAPYYPTFIKSQERYLSKIPDITSKEIDELNEIKSFSTKDASIISEMKFPVILFSPGFGMQVQLYENIISELVSNGYIVVGINTTFINGDISLPNGHVVTTAKTSREEANKKFPTTANAGFIIRF